MLEPATTSPPPSDALPSSGAALALHRRLPPQPTRLLGREGELELVCSLLARDDVRLLTLTGPGGVGKTRLAIAAAEAALDAFPGGAWFVDLAPLADPALVVPTIARTLAVRETPAQGPAEALVAFLRDRAALLVLDNLEHLLPAAASVDALLADCSRLAVLATSRAPLRLRREQVVEVPPLAVPSAHRASWTVASLTAVPTVELFVARARAADADFVLSEGNADAVAELTRHLDGLPLAVELAAARTRLLAPSALLARMEHGLSLLRWDAPDLPPRQRTLRATLDWSYALLTPEEQSVLRRLSVFAGGFALEAAEAVASTTALGLEPLEVMQGLVDKHLLRVLEGEGEAPRFGLLETVREFVLERLEEHGEAEQTRDRHLAYYLDLAEQADRAMLSPSETTWLNRLDGEVDNLRRAQEWAIARGDPETEWRLVAALALFWVLRGYLRDGIERTDAARSRSYHAKPALRARFLEGAGLLALWSGDDDRALADFAESVAAAEAAGDRARAVHVRGHLAYVAYALGDVDRARAVIAEMLTLAREVDSGLDIGYAFVWSVLIAIGPHGSPREQEQLRTELDEPVARLRQAGVRRDLAELLAGRARLLVDIDAPAAFAALREALGLGRGADDPLMFSIVPWLALVLLAERLTAEQLARLSGGVAALQERSKTIGGRTHIDVFGAPQDRLMLARAVAAARAELGDAAFATAEAAGWGLTFDALLADLLAVLDGAERSPAPGVDQSPQPGGLLSPREREVLALVAQGRSNKEIAEALFIAPTTAKFHVTSLLNKLGADTRAQLVALAAERGLL